MYEHRAQLRFSDTDAMGHINHARFATLFEDARIGLLRSIAASSDDLPASGMILARLEIDYVRPLVLDGEPVSVFARVVRIGTSSFSIDYALEQHGAICARGLSVLVAYDYGRAQSRTLTDAERTQLQTAQEDARAV
jgi:acyl-CoA thioester hydrolase